ncbi:unnamed protein product, partial [Allacma fusca]
IAICITGFDRLHCSVVLDNRIKLNKMKSDNFTGAFQELPVPTKLLTAGLAACFADFVSFPLDTAKVRLQVSRI